MFANLKERCFGPGFAGRVRRAAEGNGWAVHGVTSRGAHLVFDAGGQRYLLTLRLRSDGGVAVAAHSNGEFRPRRFPPAVRGALEQRNRELAGLSWAVLDGANLSSAAVGAACPLASLDAGTLDRLVRRLLDEVRRLDDGLRATGLI